jgi:hypothetical protein
MIFFKADDNGQRKSEADALIQSCGSRIEYLHAEQSVGDGYNQFSLSSQSGVNKSTSGVFTNLMKFNSPSTTSVNSFQTVDGPWNVSNTNTHGDDTDGISLYSNNDSVSIMSSSMVWENDKDVPACRSCARKFSFLIRRHHCRYYHDI